MPEDKHKTFGAPGEVDIKKYLKHREFRIFYEKMQKVPEVVSDGQMQNSAKLVPSQQWDFRKNTKSEPLFTCILAPKGGGGTFPEGVI